MASQIHRSFFVTLLAVALFSPMFVLKAIGPFDFWWWMSSNLVVLITLSLILDSSYPAILKKDFSSQAFRKIAIGLGSATFLYLLFFVETTSLASGSTSQAVE